jgi:hypothetical protein
MACAWASAVNSELTDRCARGEAVLAPAAVPGPEYPRDGEVRVAEAAALRTVPPDFW